MDDNLVSVRDIAAQCGRRKQTVFKILKRLGIQAIKQRSKSGKNQKAAYITLDEFKLVEYQLVTIRGDDGEDELNGAELVAEQGVFYLVQLEPKFDPNRLKVGFTINLPERLRHIKCCAPFAIVLRSWPCRPLWEKTAIDSVSAGCERLHTEVFRASSLDAVAVKCEEFFAVLPPVPISPSCVSNGPTEQAGAFP